ncbi:phenolic acid decarboxylase [Streptacidiphilus sp. N1-10]|uniref:Phenolic acid decarboxylase n=1 Tax=Streptacidiphilus jeojiensis TaxID=3229225 RepID=A0ABV6XXX4_9ACTN
MSDKPAYQDEFESTRPDEIAPLIGKHLIYTYDNGWGYEIYIRNERAFDYRIHDGPLAGRWVNNQAAHIVRLADGVYKWSWDEPTGTIVSLAVNLNERVFHGATFFPAWIPLNYDKIALHQNEHLDEMAHLRDQGPTYPKLVMDEFAQITFIEDCGRDNDEVIDRPPSEVPEGYMTRRN